MHDKDRSSSLWDLNNIFLKQRNGRNNVSPWYFCRRNKHGAESVMRIKLTSQFPLKNLIASFTFSRSTRVLKHGPNGRSL